jgi:hypothetical protein
MQQRRFGLTAEGLDKLQARAMSVELLELLKANMLEKTGEVQAESGWNFKRLIAFCTRYKKSLCLYAENFSTEVNICNIPCYLISCNVLLCIAGT